MKFTFLYGPVDNENTGVVSDKGILIYQVDDTNFDLTLTEPADADIDIVVYAIIWDDVGAEVCNTSGTPDTWTVLTGNRTDSKVLTLCGGGIPVGGCMEVDIVSVSGGWTARIDPNYDYYCEN